MGELMLHHADDPLPSPGWLQEFLRLEAAGGLILIAAAGLAMLVANSPVDSWYTEFLAVPLEVRVGTFAVAKPLLLWINDGLMAVFFLLVGLELKREVLEGHLSSMRSAALPAFVAVGGMAGPAVIYSMFNWGDPIAMRGWAIPSATDIAFALGILSLLGSRVPPGLKAFLLSIAIFDDLGAILVIAFFYTAELSMVSLVVAAVALVGLAVLNRLGVVRLTGYVLLGLVLWVAVLKSGVHATLAGVALAMFIPLRPRPGGAAEEAPASPALWLEHALHPWVAFGIMPLFAFANAGVPVLGLSLADTLQPVPLGVAVGLIGGNMVGVTGMSLLTVALGVASLPQGVKWSHVFGTSLLCGVGFTMSLFVASLAFEQGGTTYPGVERLGVLVGSFVAAVAGYVVLWFVLPGQAGSGRGPGLQ
jgi:NhaA family Na+:H+ antiporter